MQNESEIARLLAQFDSEYQAAWNGLHGLASGTAQHNFINARLENAGKAIEELELLVGEQQTEKLIGDYLSQKG